jgi:amino acid transporter
LWLLGLLIFLIPLGVSVLELSSRLPGEGGLYLWAKAAFGDGHAFVAGWIYWVSNLVFFPSLLMFGAGVFCHVAGDRWLALADDHRYMATFCVAALWFATLLNIVGLERSRWLQNVGGIATWIAGAMIVVAGLVAWSRFGAATVISPRTVWPDFHAFATFTTLTTIALAYAGLELGPIMGGEIRDPRRVLPRAILISACGIAVLYVVGTASLLVALPQEQIDVIGGIPQALSAVGVRVGFPLFGSLTAALIVLSNLGGLGAFVSGTARLPLVVGVDRYLPESLAALHPKYGTPWVALLVQAVVTTLILLAALSGSTIHEAFIVLIDLTVILSLLPLLYIFAALPVLRMRAAGRNDGITLVPGGTAACWFWAGLGFATTSFAVLIAMVPPAGSNVALFFLKVVGGSALLVGAGLLFYVRGRRHARRAAART